uniref:Integrase catalytic domain-containing protein n=1 Tax=Mycena chlorophos TaxID=658473 RepID=A0ABQ0LFK3_MYCCL|nr:predicted protein [Mycena chlorophos]
MLDNPGMGPNATINRWIEQILMFHFTLKHVKGATFSPDGLSRRRKVEGDEEFKDTKEGFDENPPPDTHKDWDYTIQQPFELGEFIDQIDTRGGFLFEAKDAYPEAYGYFETDCWDAYEDRLREAEAIRDAYAQENVQPPEYLSSDIRGTEPLLPSTAFKWDEAKREPYDEQHRSANAIWLEAKLEDVKAYINSGCKRPEGMTTKKFRDLEKYASQFFVGKDGRLFRKGSEGMNRLVVEKEHCMFMMKSAHDSLGHRGVFATKSLIEVRLWWPELESDVAWYVKTCHMCQVRQRNLVRIPPVPTMTPSLFAKIHTDVMVISEVSNGHKLVVAARDSLSRWLEAKALRSDTTQALAMFLLENIICRWGCPREIVTDNAPQFLAAVEWLARKYGITGIRISPYNSQANGPVERGHADIRQSLAKATGGNGSKWCWFLPQVVWADRVTV